MPSLVQIQTTLPTSGDAERVARLLVERRLAACVQVSGPISSVYRWEGAVEQSQEWLCTIKTLQCNFDQVSAAIAQAHPYACPEIVMTQFSAASPAYEDWLRAQVDADQSQLDEAEKE